MAYERTREQRLRRMAIRQGLALVKSRRRDPRALDFGAYWLVDARTNVLVCGDPTYGGMNIDEIERELTGDRP